MDNVKITIITASFNSAKTIGQTIQSVLDQTYKNIEYIIFDAASTDDTLRIIKGFESSFNNNLIWKSEPDDGIYDAWNKGLSISTGDWIMFVGSDDILCKNAVGTYVEAIQKNQGTICCLES